MQLSAQRRGMTQILEHVCCHCHNVILSAVATAIRFRIQRFFDENVTNSRAIVCTTHINLMIMKSSTCTVHSCCCYCHLLLGDAFYFWANTLYGFNFNAGVWIIHVCRANFNFSLSAADSAIQKEWEKSQINNRECLVFAITIDWMAHQMHFITSIGYTLKVNHLHGSIAV